MTLVKTTYIRRKPEYSISKARYLRSPAGSAAARSRHGSFREELQQGGKTMVKTAVVNPVRAPRYRDFVLAAAFSAIILIMAFTPLGYIPLPFIKMTIIHIPVILGAVLLGPKYGAFLGFLFGATSLINNTITPALTSFTFSPAIPVPGTGKGTPLALLVCFLPRILVGVLPYFAYRGILKAMKNTKAGEIAALATAGVAGAMTNTVGVMGLIYLLFRDAYAAVKGISADMVAGVVLGIVGTNGVIEAIGAGILVAAVGKILLQLKRRQG